MRSLCFCFKASSFIAIDVSYARIDTALNMKNCLSNLILFEEMQILLWQKFSILLLQTSLCVIRVNVWYEYEHLLMYVKIWNGSNENVINEYNVEWSNLFLTFSCSICHIKIMLFCLFMVQKYFSFCQIVPNIDIFTQSRLTCK